MHYYSHYLDHMWIELQIFCLDDEVDSMQGLWLKSQTIIRGMKTHFRHWTSWNRKSEGNQEL